MTTTTADRIDQLEKDRLDEVLARLTRVEAENLHLQAVIDATTNVDIDSNTKVRPTYGYYRQPNGWITASPATSTDELRYRRGGWTPLLQYGNFEMGTPYMANHPLEPLFMRGGAHELTEDQIRKQGLHLAPPLVPNCRTTLSQDHMHHERACWANAKPVVLPQLAGMTGLEPFPCSICDRVLPTQEARDQHTTVMHAPEKSDERTGKSLSDALIKGLGGANPLLPPSKDEWSAPTNAVAMKGLLAHMEKQQHQLEAMSQELAALRAAKARRARRSKAVVV